METVETSRNRVETRKLEVLNAAELRIVWPGLMQIGRITRTRSIKRSGKTSVEIVPFITSLPESQTTPEQLLALNRNHWSIENHLHRSRDLLMNEDRCSTRKGNAPLALAALRSATLALIHQSGQKPKAALEHHQLFLQKLLKTLLYKK